MQSTLTSTETDPHDIFVVEPDVVLAARADHAASDPISPLLAPPIHPRARSLGPGHGDGTAGRTNVSRGRRRRYRGAAGLHVSGERAPRGRWASRAIIGFVFALGSAAAAEGWDHYGDTAKAFIANWTPFVLNSSPPPENAAVAGQPGAAEVQGSSQAAADQAPAQPAPPAQLAPDGIYCHRIHRPRIDGHSRGRSRSLSAVPAIDGTRSRSDGPRDRGAQGQYRAAQGRPRTDGATDGPQMVRHSVARTTQTRPSDIKPADQSLRAKATAALSPRPAAPPPRRPRPAYPPAPVYAPSQAAALPPAVAAPPSQPAPLQYERRTQAADQADGDPVVRPPMPVR